MTQNDQAAMNEQLTELRLNGLSIDGDNRYKQDLIDAIIGAMMFGAQGANPPPAGHWLEQFYVIAREERQALAQVEAERDGLRVAVQHESTTRRHPSLTLGAVLAELQSSQAQLAEAVALLKTVMESTGFREILSAERDIAAFLARHAQEEKQEAKPATFYDAIVNPPRLPPRLKEVKGAQAGDEQEAFCKAVQTAAKEYDFKPETDSLLRDAAGEFVHAETRQLHRICQLYRAALATQPAVQDEADQFFEQVKAELRRARANFPGDRIMTLALAEEFGELCKAVLDESAEAVRKEAVQVACMAARVVLDGDGSVVDWRRERGLDPLLDAMRGAEHE